MVANTSLLIAVLVYMGWAYDTALYGYFHVDAFDLNIGIIEYMLVSLSLFKPVLVIAAVALILANAAWIWRTDSRGQPSPPVPATEARNGQRLLTGAGVAITVIALGLALTSVFVQVNAYLLLSLLGAGPLLLTWPARADRRGRFPYALSIVLAAVCALWAASLYANSLGKHAAQQIAHDLAGRTAVSLYTTQPLALSGPGVYMQVLPAGSLYRYRYQGLRLLTMRSGTYYLLPIHWNSREPFTYIIDSSDQIRVELY